MTSSDRRDYAITLFLKYLAERGFFALKIVRTVKELYRFLDPFDVLVYLQERHKFIAFRVKASRIKLPKIQSKDLAYIFLFKYPPNIIPAFVIMTYSDKIEKIYFTHSELVKKDIYLHDINELIRELEKLEII